MNILDFIRPFFPKKALDAQSREDFCYVRVLALFAAYFASYKRFGLDNAHKLRGNGPVIQV